VLYRHLWPVQFYRILTHTLSTARLSEKVIEHKMCFDFVYNLQLKYFSFQEELSENLS